MQALFIRCRCAIVRFSSPYVLFRYAACASMTAPLSHRSWIHLDFEYDDLEIGPLLRRLRGETSLREVNRLTGMSNVYLSQVEKGEKHPGPRILKRLAALYGVGVEELLRRAGYMEAEVEVPRPDAALDVERAYRFVLDDPRFRVGTRPSGPLSMESKRFIVGDVRAPDRQEAAGFDTVAEGFLRGVDWARIVGLESRSGAHGQGVRALHGPVGLSGLRGADRQAAQHGDRFDPPQQPPSPRHEGYSLPARQRRLHDRVCDGCRGRAPRSFTVLHETHEIIYEILAEIVGQAPYPKRRACREADRFAAAVLMQPGPFSAYALATGLDVVALRGHYDLSYAALALRLGEVMPSQPMLAVLYERRERGDPGLWVEIPSIETFRASVAVRTPGFGVRDSRMLCGARGLMPVRGRPLSPGSAAERVVLTGRACYAESEPGRGGARKGDMAMAARPVVWKGRVAKVAVIAVPAPRPVGALAPAVRGGVRAPSRRGARRLMGPVCGPSQE